VGGITPLLCNAAGNACAASAQWRRLVRIVIAAGVDHDGMSLNVGHREVWCDDGFRGLAAGIDGHHRHIALVSLALRPEMLAGIGRIEMATGRQARCRLAVRPLTGTAIGIGVDVKTWSPGGRPASCGAMRSPPLVSERRSVPTCLPIPLASIAFMVTVTVAASAVPAPTAAIAAASGIT
jgi:hypothetical protein